MKKNYSVLVDMIVAAILVNNGEQGKERLRAKPPNTTGLPSEEICMVLYVWQKARCLAGIIKTAPTPNSAWDAETLQVLEVCAEFCSRTKVPVENNSTVQAA